MAYVKNYNPGQIHMDLPTANYIYELPLLSFGDIHGSMNLSMVYNRQMKSENNNPYNIAAGFKLNLHKKLTIENGKPVKLQEANGNVVNLIGSSFPYTFADDSHRMIRLTDSTYTLENADMSRETYDQQGKITCVYDRYGVEVLKYEYDAAGKLTSVICREKTVSFAYSSSKLSSIAYGGKSITLGYSEVPDMVSLSCNSGERYNFTPSDELNFVAKVFTLDEFLNEEYFEQVTAEWDGDRTITLKKTINSNIVDSVTYSYPEYIDTSTPSGIASTHCQVETTDFYGVKIRTQYDGRKAMYSYEITGNDVEFRGDGKPLVPIHILNGAEGNANVKVVGSYNLSDGIALGQQYNTAGDLIQTWISPNLNDFSAVTCYYLTGWARKLNEEDLSGHEVQVATSGAYISLPLNIGSVSNWSFFAFAVSWNGTSFVVEPGDDAMTELKDIRLFYMKDNILEDGSKSHSVVTEDVLICHSDEEDMEIPIRNATIACGSISTGNEDISVSYADLLKFKIAQKRGTITNEFYYKNVNQPRVLTGVVTSASVTYEGMNYLLSNCYLARRNYTRNGVITTRIRDDDSSAFLVYETLDADGNILASQTLDSHLDVISQTSDGVVTTYARSGGLVTSESAATTSGTILYTRTAAYGEDTSGNPTITMTDEFSNSTVYTLNPVWGVVTSVRRPDGTLVQDGYDDDMCTQINRVFVNSTPRANAFTYSGGNLSRLTTGGLQYTFTYNNGDLTAISKNDITIEQHVYTDATDNAEASTESYYPSQDSKLYSTKATFDKYGRLTAIDGILTNVYDVQPDFDSSTGALIPTVNNGNAFLAMTTDEVRGETARFCYDSDDLLVEKTVTDETDFTDKISQETFEYDRIHRLTKDTCTYDAATGKTVTSTIVYAKSADDPLADNRVSAYNYAVAGSGAATTLNSYDDFKRLKAKTYILGNTQFTRNIRYQKTRVSYELDSAGGYTTYGQDSQKRIVSIISGGKATKYSYDTFGQLVREDNQALDKTFVYCYNYIGNLESVKTYAYTTDASLSGTPVTTSYVYTADRLTSFGGTTIAYNAIGCPTTYDGKTATWSKGKLTKLSSGTLETGLKNYTYTYNGFGQRVAQNYAYVRSLTDDQTVVSGELTASSKQYFYDHAGRLISEEVSKTYRGEGTTTEKIVFLYDESSIIGMEYTVGGTTSTYYFHRNLLGDVIGIYDTSGALVAKYLYDAWGNCTIGAGTTNNTLAHANPIRYRGYYYDDDTGLYYLNARYYSPKWRRFISPSDASCLDSKSVNGLNQYCYCGNNPIEITFFNQPSADKNYTSGIVGTIGKSTFSPSKSGFLNSFAFDPNFLSNWFSHNENVFSTGAGIVEGIRRSRGLGQLEALSKISTVLMHAGYWLSIGLSAYNNFTNAELSNREQWVSFAVDTVYSTGQTVGSFFLGCIPYAGPFLAIAVPIGVDYIWSGELCIFGYDIDVKPWKPYGKTVEEWVKYWVNSWFE